jgi:exonuclease I
MMQQEQKQQQLTDDAATCEEEKEKEEEKVTIKDNNNTVVIIDGKKTKKKKKKRLVSHIKTIAKQGSNILTRSKPFKTLVDKVFNACDTSKSNDVSKSELYVGLLSIHITLARYAGPAACFVSFSATFSFLFYGEPI